jgi:hypothetical protein
MFYATTKKYSFNKPLQELAIFGHVVRPDGSEELDVIITVKFSNFILNKKYIFNKTSKYNP